MKLSYRLVFVIKVVVLMVVVPGCFDVPGCHFDFDSDPLPYEGHCYQGNFYVYDEHDVEELDQWDCIDGDLVVESSDLVSLELPNLDDVQNSVRIRNNPHLVAVTIDALRSPGGFVAVKDNASLVSVSLEGLIGVGSDLVFSDNESLVSVSVGSLHKIPGALEIEDNDALMWLGWLYADSINLFRVHGNDSLPDCEVCDLLDQLDEEPGFLFVHSNLDDECTPVPAGCEEPDTDTGSDTDTETDTDTDTETSTD